MNHESANVLEVFPSPVLNFEIINYKEPTRASATPRISEKYTLVAVERKSRHVPPKIHPKNFRYVAPRSKKYSLHLGSNETFEFPLPRTPKNSLAVGSGSFWGTLERE